MNLFIDFETFYDSKNGYDLRKLSMVEYVRDDRFKVHGVGFAFNDTPAEWISGDEINFEKMNWGDLTVIAHNAKFDGFILSDFFGEVPGRFIDTKAMAKAVLGKTVKGYSLAELAEYYGLQSKGVMKTDGVKDLTSEQEAELASYCLNDVELCRRIFGKLSVDFPENQYPMMDWTVRTFVEPKLILDVSKLEKANEEEQERRKKIFEEIGIEKEIFSSNKKFEQLLCANGYEVPKKLSPRTGQSIPALALGDPGFLALAASTNRQLHSFCEARIAAKSTLLETRTGKLAKIGRTGPWPFDIEFSGAAQTHRFSGGSGAGGNPQNFPREGVIRECVMAPPGHQLVVGDFAQIEMRLVAYLSRDPQLLYGIEKGLDLYSSFAGAFYNRQITKEDKAERQFGKCSILGLGYGMGPEKFKKTVKLQVGIDLTDEEAKRAVYLYRGKYKRVPALWKELDASLSLLTVDGEGPFLNLPLRHRHDALVLPSGLEIKYPNLRKGGKEWLYDTWKKKTELEMAKIYGGKVLENICQALAGELCKEVAQQFGNDVTGLVHDEIHLCVPDAEVDVAVQALREAMTTPPSWLPKLKLGAEVGYGKTWQEAKANAG